ISRSPDQLQPVLDVITETAVRLCRATHGHVRLLREDGAYHIAAHQIPDAELLQQMQENPFRPGMDSVAGRVALQGVTVHVADVSADPLLSGFQRRISDKIKTAMGVPLKQGGRVVGIISVWHTHVQPFTKRQINLVETFADQAVIAINNVGLFEEVQARTRELTESLEQQTATADVLKVISRSALDVQKVLDALVESAARLCDAYDAAIFQVFGNGLRLVAHHGQIPTIGPVGQVAVLLVRGAIGGRAIIDRRTIQVADMLAEADEYPESRERALRLGYRTALAVPLVHAGEAIGNILIRRAEVRPFTERQIELVNTFADQAVIAIENTRLFEEVQARTRALQESLEYQTAMSDVLGVISSSPDKLQPVLDAIVNTAKRLCIADRAYFNVLVEGRYHSVATTEGIPKHIIDDVRAKPEVAGRGSHAARALL